VVKSETEGRAGKVEGNRAHARSQLGASSLKPVSTKRAPVRDEHSTSYVAAIETAEAFAYGSTTKLGGVVGAGAEESRDRRRRVWIWNLATNTFQARSKSWISSTPASIFGNSRPSCSPGRENSQALDGSLSGPTWSEARSKR